MNFTRKDFPEDFLFGVATSSYQIEGHQFGGAGRTHWDDFAATPGNVVNGENGALACDHYHRMDEDLDLISNGNFDVYRFSTSWARILPQGRGDVNQEGLDFYDRLVDGLLDRGIKPALTLYHWELPSALADLGGWRNRDIASWFGDYTQVVMSRLGDRIWSTAPINEPWCVGFLSHFLGIHAPGLRDIRATARAMHHILLAHGTAIERMRSMGIGNLGAVCNFEYANPASDDPKDVAAAKRFDCHYNRFFMSGFFKGDYPEDMIDAFDGHLPKNWRDDMGLISQPVDWCGLNYYTRSNVAHADGAWPAQKAVEGPLPKTATNWEIYPEGLGYFLERVACEFTGDLPLYVTENGLAWHDEIKDGQVADPGRIEFLNAHFGKVREAIAKGVPVKGYYTWSLLDNYEWALGYKERFGLVHVDFKSLKRTPKTSYLSLAQALERI